MAMKSGRKALGKAVRKSLSIGVGRSRRAGRSKLRARRRAARRETRCVLAAPQARNASPPGGRGGPPGGGGRTRGSGAGGDDGAGGAQASAVSALSSSSSSKSSERSSSSRSSSSSSAKSSPKSRSSSSSSSVSAVVVVGELEVVVVVEGHGERRGCRRRASASAWRKGGFVAVGTVGRGTRRGSREAPARTGGGYEAPPRIGACACLKFIAQPPQACPRAGARAAGRAYPPLPIPHRPPHSGRFTTALFRCRTSTNAAPILRPTSSA